MARTWSVPHRGNFANLATHRMQANASLMERLQASRRDARRGPLLLVSALLTAIGIAILNIDSQSLATFLLVAGAGLAATIILSSGQIAADQTASRRRSAASSRAATPSQFAELFVCSPENSALDRAAWAKLTAHMSHELRTPLNAVLGFSEIMSNEVFGPLGSTAYSEYARDIHSSGRMLLKSAEDALAITALLTAPPHKGVPQSCCLRSILNDVCAFLETDLATRSITIEQEIAADAEIVGDPQATRQMLINLFSEGARKACTGAVIRVRAIAVNESVVFSLALSEQECCEPAIDEGFGMILARTLCELSNARLNVADTSDGGAAWTVQFLAATQNDLFSKSV